MLLGAYKREIPPNLITGLSPILYNCLHESVWIIHTHHPTSTGEQRNGHVRASDFDPRINQFAFLTPGDLRLHFKDISRYQRYSRYIIYSRYLEIFQDIENIPAQPSPVLKSCIMLAFSVFAFFYKRTIIKKAFGFILLYSLLYFYIPCIPFHSLIFHYIPCIQFHSLIYSAYIASVLGPLSTNELSSKRHSLFPTYIPSVASSMGHNKQKPQKSIAIAQ